MTDELILNQIRKLLADLANNNNQFIHENFGGPQSSVDETNIQVSSANEIYYAQFKLFQQGLLRAEEALSLSDKKNKSEKKQIPVDTYYKAKSKYNGIITELSSAKRYLQSLMESKKLYEASEQQRVVLKLEAESKKLYEKMEKWESSGRVPRNTKKHTDIPLAKLDREKAKNA